MQSEVISDKHRKKLENNASTEIQKEAAINACYIRRERILNANPPAIRAVAKFAKEIVTATFHPKSLARTEIVERHGK